MKRIGAISWLILPLAAVVCIRLCAQQNGPSGRSTIHISADVRELTGDPLQGLSASNFSLSASGMRLPFKLRERQKQEPEYVLIIVAPASGYISLPLVRDYMSRSVPFDSRTPYQLSVLGPHGEYAGFQSSRTALVQDLYPERVKYSGYLQAAQDLGERKGRRAILYVTNRVSGVPPDLEAAARDAGALIYEVGASSDQNYVYSGQPESFTLPGVHGQAGGGLLWGSAAWESIRTIYAEPSMKKAFREIERERLGAYDLTVDVPAGARAIQLKPRIGGQYQLNAFAYGEDGSAVPELRLVEKSPK